MANDWKFLIIYNYFVVAGRSHALSRTYAFIFDFNRREELMQSAQGQETIIQSTTRTKSNTI